MVVPLDIMSVVNEDDAVFVDRDSMEIVDELWANNQEVEEGIHNNLAIVEVEEQPPLNVVQNYYYACGCQICYLRRISPCMAPL
ncbi:hypothetical protein AMTR_s00019p00106700 [Amborella trichopoda]|uniref:Uncharacterized protein n=1 Tax=Amborella trichopoda TaxID=13333 RepID=W1PJ28_AMBTC|nr:hypothetical protein AMTR_s00019p00106700 [Amborella trichopoda]